MALGTGPRLGEPVGLNVGDVCVHGWELRVRVRTRPNIAKGGREAGVFLIGRLTVVVNPDRSSSQVHGLTEEARPLAFVQEECRKRTAAYRG